MSDAFADRVEAFYTSRRQGQLSDAHESEVLAAQANVATARAPDLAAKANEASRSTGIPAGAYDADYLKIFDTQRKQAAIEKVGVKYPKVATFLANPDNAAVAQDDVDNLGNLGALWEGLRKQFATDSSFLDKAGNYITRRAYGLQAGFDRFTVASNKFFESLTPPAQRSAEANAAMKVQQPFYRDRAVRNEAIQALPIAGEVSWDEVKKRPTAKNIAKFIGQQGAASIPDMAMVIASIPLYVVGRSGEIGQDRARNNNRSEATMGDVVKGAPAAVISAYLERLGIEKMLFPNAENVVARIAKATAAEGTTEFVQEGVENTGSTLGTDKGWDPAQILDQSLAAAVGGSGTGAAIRTTIETPSIVFKGAEKVVSSTIRRNAAEGDAQSLDKLAAVAEASKTRTRDPQAYESLVAALSADSGAENIYIPAEKVREYLQSSDWDSVEFWQEYDEEISNGTISNGDVVVPVSKAITHLAGTPAWEALKGDMRLSPGGMSMNEAQEADKGLPQEIDRLSDEVSAQLEADRAAAEPRQKLFDTALQKLHEAGQTLSEATKNAMLVANRYATRAARLGREVTGNEFDNVKVQQILPAGLAPMVAADNLSLVIRAMRRGKAVKDKSGPSLLEWIASKGGIEDRGGELKAMGADKWHKGKVGQKKLLRSFNRGQMSMLGSDGQQNSNSPDELAMRAWEAGYFPEFTERPSVNDLLNAIAEGVAGRDRYIPDALQPDETDQMRLAAQDLYQLLDQAGLDPEKASETEIKQAIQRYQEQASRGQGFDQVELPDTIDIDGVPRSTKNSNGAPLASTEEGVRAFWSWFGDSKVVDDQGRPLVVYHGTDAKISKVNLKKGAQGLFWFSSDKAKIERGDAGAAGRGNIMPLYAKIESPADWGEYDRKMLFELRHDYDGAILAEKDGSFDGFILNEATQIKSVNNRGTFDPTDPRILFQSAYHGSPHIFDKFSLEAIGSGEGAQAYGWGLYFAGKKEVAQHYRDALSAAKRRDGGGFDMEYRIGKKVINRSNRVEFKAADLAVLAQENERLIIGDYGSVTKWARSNIGAAGFTDEDANATFKAFQKFRKQNIDKSKVSGRLYHVEIPEDDQYLLWDAPLNEQPEKVKAAFKDLGNNPPDGISKFDFKNALFKAEWLDPKTENKVGGLYAYKNIAEILGSEEAASKALRDAGIAGIKYLDGGSRADGDGSYNYVVFDDNAVSIKAYEQSTQDALRTDYSIRASVPKVRGGWTIAKIKNYLKSYGGRTSSSKQDLKRAVSKFDSPEEVAANIFYHGTGAYVERGLKAGAVLKNVENFGGGYGEIQHSISLSRSRNIASNFTGQARSGTVYPVLLKKGANVIERPEFNDAIEVEDHLVELWDQGVDAVIIGDHSKPNSEQEIVVLNPSALVKIEGEHFQVFQKKAFNNLTVDEITALTSETARILYQTYSDGPRGRVTFGNGMAVIDLFQQRDLSTFIHEMAHVWLEELQADAALPEAPQQLRDDLQAVFDWFAANGHPVVDGVIPVEAHEMWARGTERYTMEGKAPSSALRRAFEAFRAWMLSIYHLADNLRAPITPEIRGVMDRLIATDEEIQQASEEQNLKALFDSVEAAAKFGMNEAAYKDYVKSATEAKDEAFDRLLFKTMETVRRERTKAYKDERDAVAADVRSSVDARPVFRALASLRAVNGLKLDKQWLINTYGEDVLASLPKGVPPIYKDGGVDADMIAEASGFSTGDEMVKALIGVEDRRASLREGGDKRSARDSIIDEETDAIMKERYGDPLSDGSIEEEALALIHNEKQGELQATELRVLSSKTKAETRATPYRIARLWAADKIRNGQVKDVASRAAIQRYLRAAAKAGKAAEQAYMAGDTDEAFKQKQAQMLNNALVAEAKQAADAIDIAVARMSRLAKRRTIKSMDQDYLERIHDLLESVDLKERTQASIDRQGSFEEWRAEQEAKGHDIVTPAGFAESIGKTHWSRLTVEKLLGLDETVKQIAHLGRYKQQLIDNKVQREFDEVVAEAQAAIAKLPPKPPSDLMEPSRWDVIKSRVASMDASLLKMETVFDWLDSGDSNGVFNRIVFRPIADAQDREKAMLTDYTGRLTDLLKAIPKEQLKRWSEKVSLPELLNRETGNPWIMTRDQLVSMALNMGNEGNIQRLVDGYGWNEEAVRRALNRELTAADWQYVQNVWDTIDSLWPEAAALERRVNGVEPDKVEAVPVVTDHGTLRGGYFPAIYDPRKSIEAEANAAKASDVLDKTYTKATTRASSTKERSDKVKQPIYLSLSVINRHVGEIIHDITHREAIIQADKFLTSKRIMKAVDETLGPEVRKQFRPWLQHIANEWANDRKGVAGWDWWIKKLRTNTSIVGMGFRLSTIVMQVAGYSNSFERVGAKWVAPQLAKAVDPRAYRFVMERSSEVRNRMDTLERDVRENVKQLAGRTDLIANARKFAFYGIGYMDRVVVIPTWLGAYNRGISEGMSEADAGYYADKAVRQSQGAGAAKDLAAVQRSNEWMRLATMFYSYQSAIYQRFRSLGRDARTAGVRDVPDLIARSFWLIVVPPLLSELLAGRGPDDDEDWGMWSFQKMLAGLFGPIPIARDVVNAAQSGFGYSFTPAARAFETGLNVWTDAGNLWEGDDTKRATRNVLELSGYTLGLPTGQLASSTQFIVDVSEGEQDPQTITDWMEGLSKGKLSDN